MDDLKLYNNDIQTHFVITSIESPSFSFVNRETHRTRCFFKTHSCKFLHEDVLLLF